MFCSSYVIEIVKILLAKKIITRDFTNELINEFCIRKAKTKKKLDFELISPIKIKSARRKRKIDEQKDNSQNLNLNRQVYAKNSRVIDNSASNQLNSFNYYSSNRFFSASGSSSSNTISGACDISQGSSSTVESSISHIKQFADSKNSNNLNLSSSIVSSASSETIVDTSSGRPIDICDLFLTEDYQIGVYPHTFFSMHESSSNQSQYSSSMLNSSPGQCLQSGSNSTVSEALLGSSEFNSDGIFDDENTNAFGLGRK